MGVPISQYQGDGTRALRYPRLACVSGSRTIQDATARIKVSLWCADATGVGIEHPFCLPLAVAVLYIIAHQEARKIKLAHQLGFVS